MFIQKHIFYPFKYPYIIPGLIKNYCSLIFFKKKVLRGVELALTYKCNSACSHCSCKKLDTAHNSYMPIDTIKKVVDQCIGLGALQINLTGGEALYHPQIMDITKYIGSKKVVLSVATNGLLLTGDAVKKLAKRKVRIITISIESPHPKEHDERHNLPGCYAGMINAVQNAKEAGMDVFLCTICTASNMRNGDMWKMISLAAELEVMITLNIACPVGGWDNNGRSVLLGEDDLKEYRRMLTLSHVRWEGGSNYLKEGCPAGVEKIYISASGDVMPCPRVHINYGNINTTPLKDIWAKMIDPSSPFHNSNHTYSGCPAGDDKEFINTYLKGE